MAFVKVAAWRFLAQIEAETNSYKALQDQVDLTPRNLLNYIWLQSIGSSGTGRIRVSRERCREGRIFEASSDVSRVFLRDFQERLRGDLQPFQRCSQCFTELHLAPVHRVRRLWAHSGPPRALGQCSQQKRGSKLLLPSTAQWL